MNYDLDTIEEKFKSAKRTEDWAEAFVSELSMVFNAVESMFTCTICNNLMGKTEDNPAITVFPCQHSFCKKCHKDKTKRVGECSRCYNREKEIVDNNNLNEFAE
jgi:hypothetical protein